MPLVPVTQLPRAHRRSLLLHAPPDSTHWVATHFFDVSEHTPFAHWLLVVHGVPSGPGAAHLPLTQASAERQSDSDVHAAPASPRRVHFTAADAPSILQARPSPQLGGADDGFDGS